jgi:hypothetical protein
MKANPTTPGLAGGIEASLWSLLSAQRQECDRLCEELVQAQAAGELATADVGARRLQPRRVARGPA